MYGVGRWIGRQFGFELFHSAGECGQRREMTAGGAAPNHSLRLINTVFIGVRANEFDRRLYILDRGGEGRLAAEAVIQRSDGVTARGQRCKYSRKIVKGARLSRMSGGPASAMNVEHQGMRRLAVGRQVE